MARANGCDDRVSCVEVSALPVHADVVVAPMPGEQPIFAQALADPAVRRLIAGGATPIPRQERLSIAVVNAPDVYFRHAGVWETGHDLDLGVAKRLALNSWSACRMAGDRLIVDASEWASVDYAGAPTAIAGTAEWTIDRPDIAHGLVVWSDVTFAEGVDLRNAPASGDAPIGETFFPWLEPVDLARGDRVSVAIRGDALGAGNVWTWNTSIQRVDKERHAFRQSTFHGDLSVPALPRGTRP
jgi:hypothetical protein